MAYSQHASKLHPVGGRMGMLDPAERATEKRVSREADARALASGEKTRAQLWSENTLLPARMTSVNLRAIPLPK